MPSHCRGRKKEILCYALLCLERCLANEYINFYSILYHSTSRWEQLVTTKATSCWKTTFRRCRGVHTVLDYQRIPSSQSIHHCNKTSNSKKCLYKIRQLKCIWIKRWSFLFKILVQWLTVSNVTL